MINIINIIIIIICKFHARVCQWLQDDTKRFCLVPSSNPSGGRYSVVQDHFPCSGSWVHIVLWRSFSLFIQSQVSSLPPAKFSDDHRLRKLWQRDRISITGFDDWFRQKKNTGLESHLLVQIATPLKIQNLFQNCSNVSTERYAFPTTTKIILFFFYWF